MFVTDMEKWRIPGVHRRLGGRAGEAGSWAGREGRVAVDLMGDGGWRGRVGELHGDFPALVSYSDRVRTRDRFR